MHSDRVKEGNLEEQRSIKLSTYGIIFMGTPHQGGQGVNMGKILINVAKVQGDTSDSLLKHLEEHSDLLQQQISEFSLISQSFDIKFAYETKPTPLFGVVAKVVCLSCPSVITGFMPDLTLDRLSPNGLRWSQERPALQNSVSMRTTEI